MMKDLIIRQEKEEDYPEIFNLIEEAFREMEMADGDEHYLVDRLRKTEAYIPELSLVADLNGKLVGHILFTKIWIQDGEQKHPSLILAPVSVLPEYQRMGIGGELIQEGHRIAVEFGYQSVLVIGHEDYYPRFNYRIASNYGLKAPFEVPDQNCMVCELVEGGLEEISGVVEISELFY